MRRIFNWIKKAVTFDSDVTVGNDLTVANDLVSENDVKLGDPSEDRLAPSFVIDISSKKIDLVNFFGVSTIGDGYGDNNGCGIMVDVPNSYIHILAASINFPSLPTSDPSEEGRVWNDSGTLKISAG